VKGKAKASSGRPSSKKRRHEIIKGHPEGGSSPVLPLQGSSLSNGFEGSSLSKKKVYSFVLDFLLS
jgi:hypothetical protein